MLTMGAKEIQMPDPKTEKKIESSGCGSCGDKRVMLSEEKNSPPRCAGCGKPVPRPKT